MFSDIPMRWIIHTPAYEIQKGWGYSCVFVAHGKEDEHFPLFPFNRNHKGEMQMKNTWHFSPSTNLEAGFLVLLQLLELQPGALLPYIQLESCLFYFWSSLGKAVENDPNIFYPSGRSSLGLAQLWPLESLREWSNGWKNLCLSLFLSCSL